jgi:outer membrane protein OmpA-like peptidoglycan-associated protein
MKTYYSTLAIVSICSAAVLLSACETMDKTQSDTAKGAAIGAIAGAVLGNTTAGGNRSRSTSTGAIVGAAAGAAGGYLWSKKMQEQKQAMEQATQGTGVAVTQTPDNQLKLEIPSDISFDVGRSDIKSNFAPVLDKFANGLTQHQVTTVKIVGHTDSQGSDALNDPLSQSRASSAKSYLVSKGVASQRIETTGRGEHEPIADNNTTDGRAKNRRVEIFIAEPAQVSQAPAK